jgi:hypothetical protein
VEEKGIEQEGTEGTEKPLFQWLGTAIVTPMDSMSENAREDKDEGLLPPDPLYAWVDSNPPSPDKQFARGRATKLFVAIMLSSILAGLPILLLQIGLLSIENAKKEAVRQEQLEKDWQEMGKAVREGKAGEAARRLFGVESPAPRKPGQ